MIPFNDLTTLLFGRNCVHCNSSLIQQEQYLCVLCRSEISQIEADGEEALKMEQLFYGKAKIEKVVSGYHFIKGGASQSLIHHLKYHNLPSIGKYEGELLAHKLLKNKEFSDVDAIVPVPMTFKKRRKRGYNQSEQIAKGLRKALQKPILKKLLKRKVQKKSQTKLNKFTRWQNMNESFELNQYLPSNCKHILLVDDVITTGATLESCANAIQKKYNIKISIVALAFAPLQG
jgi:competence protein ComFC